MTTSSLPISTKKNTQEGLLLLVDNQQLSNRFLTDFLRENLNSLSVQAAQSYDQALAAAASLQPRLMIVDIHLGGCQNGLHLINEVNQMGFNCKFILLTVEENTDYIRRAILEGASAYLSKSVIPNDILMAISWTLNPINKDQFLLLPADLRYLLFSDSIQSQLKQPAQNKFDTLTSSEKTILLRIGKGATVKEIAFELQKAPTTVYTHLQNIKQKLHLYSSKDIFNIALDYTLLVKGNKGSGS